MEETDNNKYKTHYYAEQAGKSECDLGLYHEIC